MMATETANNVYEEVFENMKHAAEANLKMQQEMLQQWMVMWPGLQTPQAMWVEKVRDFQHQWVNTISDLARKHRDTIDRQYQAALESLDEALRLSESSNPDEVRQRTEQLFRKSLDCIREVSEAQMKEFQDAMSKWGELVTKTGS